MKRAILATLLPTLLATLLLAATPAAAALPPAVKAMVEAAARSGDKSKTDAVVAIAKETNKGSESEIDAIVAAISAEQVAAREAKLADAGMLDTGPVRATSAHRWPPATATPAPSRLAWRWKRMG